MELKAEQLISAIRNADSLEELKRLVGADEREEAAFSQMLREQETIGDKYQWDLDLMPSHTREKFQRLGVQISDFERLYR